MRISVSAAAFFLGMLPCSAEEFRNDWCGFKATIDGKFDIISVDDRNISFAHQKLPKYLVSLICERKHLSELPNEKQLCAEMRSSAEDIQAEVVECSSRIDKSGRFVKSIVFMKTPGVLFVNAVYVASESKFTLSLADYALTEEEQVTLFERLIRSVEFVDR